jgi:hypothetical protein
MERERNMIRNPKPAIAFGLIVAALAPACAQGTGQGGGHGGIAVVAALCAKELAAHCAAFQRGPAAWVCLDSRREQLSEDCRTAVEATGPDMGPGTGPVARLCMAEIDKHCAGVEHGTGLVRECLDKHRGELGEGCVVALDKTGWGRRR